MLPGDLGNIGKASLNEEKILKLCEMLLSDSSLDVSFNDDSKDPKTSSQQPSRSSSKHRHRVSKFTPLTKKERRYLELVARLLRCAQRFFLMRAERNSSKNLMEDLIEDCTKSNNVEDEFGTNSYDGLSSDRCILSVDDLSHCPWVIFLMKSLCSSSGSKESISGETLDVSQSTQSMKHSVMKTKPRPYNQERIFRTDDILVHPMIKAVKIYIDKTDPRSTPNYMQLRVYLQIICACAEVFPRGECWSSSNEWFKSSVSPFDCHTHCDLLDSKMGMVSYCNACSSSDMAAMIHAVTDVLCSIGTVSGDLKLHMWAFLTLLKLTECSVIANKYWEKSNTSKETDQVPQAWRRVWDTIFRQDLRYISYTSTASTSSLGEVILMLLTEIVKWSLTSFKRELQLKNNKFLETQQSKVWNLPMFASAEKIQTSAPFELLSVMLNFLGVAEGQNDAFKVITNDNIEFGNVNEKDRRSRIICFCVDFIKKAVQRDKGSLLRRVTPYIGSCLACLTGNNQMLTSITSYTMNSLRIFRATDSRHCFDENNYEQQQNASAFNILWRDVFQPFAFQFDTENNPSIWDKMDGRDLRLCPPWSVEDMCWFKTSCSLKCIDINTISSRRASELQSFALNYIFNTIGYGIFTEERGLLNSATPLESRIVILKLVLSVRLLNNYKDPEHELPQRCLEECFEAILDNVVDIMKYPTSNIDSLILILSDFIGIFCLLRDCYKRGVLIDQARGLMGSDHLELFHDQCRGLVESYKPSHIAFWKSDQTSLSYVNHHSKSIEEFNNESDVESISDNNMSARIEDISSIPSPSDQGSDDFSDFDNDGDQVKKRKIKKQGGDGNIKKRKGSCKSSVNSQSREDEEDMNSIDTRLFWLSAHIMLLIDPTLESCNSIANSIIWPQEDAIHDFTEPNDCIICLSLFNKYLRLSLVDSNSGSDSISVFSLCSEVIFEGRSNAAPSSPYHMFGFHTCFNLIDSLGRSGGELNSEEIKDLIDVLHPETVDTQDGFGKKSSRSIKSRPFVRASRAQAATKCFIEGSDEFHKKYDSMFESSIVVESLTDRTRMIRRIGAHALGVALEYFPLQVQNNIVNDALNILPFCCKQLTRSTEKYEQWVKGRLTRINKSMNGFERQLWDESVNVVQADTFHCIGIIIGKTSLEETMFRMISDLLATNTEKLELAIFCFHCLEFAASLRKFASFEDQINADAFILLRNWIGSNQRLMSLPLFFCSPCMMRSILRLGYFDSAQFGSWQQNLADEFILQNASIILPCIFIDCNSEDGPKNRDRYLKEVATVCVKGDVSKLLRFHIQDIFSIAMLMMHCKKDKTSTLRKLAQEVLSFLESFPKLAQNIKKKSSYEITMQMLRIYGRNPKIHADLEISKAACLDAFEYFNTKIRCINKKSDNSIFYCAGSTTIECFLYARQLLDHSIYSYERAQAWRIMDFILDEVLRVEGSAQLGFCLNSISSTLLDSRCEDLRYEVLVKLKEMLNAFITDEKMTKQIHEDIAFILNNIVFTLIHLHEDNQSSIVKFCSSQWQEQNEKNFSVWKFKDIVSLPHNDDFPLSNLDDDTLIAITKFGDSVPMDMAKCSHLTFDILELLFQQRDGVLKLCIGDIDPFPVQIIPKEHQEALSQIDRKFNLRSLLLSFDERHRPSSRETILTVARGFQRTVKRYITNNSKMRIATDKSCLLKHDIDSRTVLSGIDRVRDKLLLENIKEEIQYQEESEILEVFSTLVETLLMLCNNEYPNEIQANAGSCLGTLIPAMHVLGINVNRVHGPFSERQTYFQENPLYHFFTNIFELLAKYVYSDDTELAIAAKDTLLSIVLKTIDGNEFWFEGGLKDELKHVLTPFVKTKKIALDVKQVQPGFYNDFIAWVDLSEAELQKTNSWCWNENIWECHSDSQLTYEDWIRNVVCAIITCCYRDENEIDTKAKIQGCSDFFKPCLYLCSVEHEFSAVLFPAILFDILSTRGSDYSTFALPSTDSNKTITRCVSHLLKPKPVESFIDEQTCSQNSTSTHAEPLTTNFKALSVVAQFLDIIRCVSEYRFYSSEHRINKTEIEGRTYDAKKAAVKIDNNKEKYNDLPPSEIFKGRPYGIVLDLQDMVLASTLMKLKDYPLALYYAENYADNLLGGVGCAFEMSSSRNIIQYSLSGFGNEIEPLKQTSDVERALSFHEILKNCFISLKEGDNLIGLEEQTSRLRFQNPEYFKVDRWNLSTINSEIKALMHADTASQMFTGKRYLDVQSHLSVISSFSNLGLRESLRHYLAGFSLNNALSSCTNEECQIIQEKWSEESWRLMQWDDSLLPNRAAKTVRNEKVDMTIGFNRDLMCEAIKKNNYQSLEIGYHESLGNLFISLLSDDMASFSTNLYHAKMCLLDEFRRDVGTKLPSGILKSSQCLKFMTLNEIEDVGSVISGLHPPSVFMEKWCSSSNLFAAEDNLNYSFNDIETAMACREICLKIMFCKFGCHTDDEIGKSYLSHLQHLCSIACRHKQPNVATASLERLRQFIDLTHYGELNDLTHRISSSKINLEEARIMHCNGDATAAVRTCKLLISSIEEINSHDSEELAFLHGEAILQCGLWLVKHKIEKNEFLSRAAEIAQEIHRKRKSNKSTKLLISSHFALADFVANLYDNAEKRVYSQEWKSLCSAADRRQKELEEIERMIANFKKDPKKTPKEKALNLLIEQGKLKKEVDMDTRERKAIEESIGQYLKLAIQTYGSALSICAGVSSHSKNIYRLVQLWFRNCNGTGNGGDINALVASEVTSKIPR